MAATFQVAAPEPFNFSRPEEWEKWIRRFERFRKVAGLEKKGEAQVNTLIYSMGDEADNILRSFSLSAEDKKYAPVKAQFDRHFTKRRNVIFERARFNMRRQEEGETVDAFITALYSLAEYCSYGALHDEMIRDRIVVGIRNATLAEKLQLDADLTLDKAVTQARQAEAIKLQQPLLRGGGKPDTPVGAVQRGDSGYKGKQSRKGSHNSGATVRKQPGSSTACSRCGKYPAHDKQHCPARDATCRKCKKRGHFQAVCRSARVGGIQGNTEMGDGLDSAFLGSVEEQCEDKNNPWTVTLKLDGKPVDLRIDTGAEVTVITEKMWQDIGQPTLSPSDRTLRGPDSRTLPVKGKFTGTLGIQTREAEEEIYVVTELAKPLLGQPAIEQLGLLRRVVAVDKQRLTPAQQFPSLFQGLRKLEGEYIIQLKEGAKPFALSTPRRVAILSSRQ